MQMRLEKRSLGISVREGCRGGHGFQLKALPACTQIRGVDTVQMRVHQEHRREGAWSGFARKIGREPQTPATSEISSQMRHEKVARLPAA